MDDEKKNKILVGWIDFSNGASLLVPYNKNAGGVFGNMLIPLYYDLYKIELKLSPRIRDNHKQNKSFRATT